MKEPRSVEFSVRAHRDIDGIDCACYMTFNDNGELAESGALWNSDEFAEILLRVLAMNPKAVEMVKSGEYDSLFSADWKTRYASVAEAIERARGNRRQP